MPGGLDAMFGGSGLKRLRLLLEEDDDDPNLRPGMRNGLCERRGGWGWTPLSKLYREEEGQEARRHEWHKSKLWLLLGDTDTGDPDTIAGGTLPGDARGVPRVVFDEWEGMAQECRLICDRSAGDGQGIKGAPNIPLKLKLAGALVWMRSRATVKFVAYFACCMDDNTLWRFMKKWARFMIWKHFGDLVSPHHRARTWNPS